MTAPIALTVARMHGVLAVRPGSPVFHVAEPKVLSRSRRAVRRAAGPLCSARTRRLSVLERDGSVLDLGGRRMCARCGARISAVARRASQPPLNRDRAVEFWRAEEVTLADFVVAVALAADVAETHTIGLALGQIFPPRPVRRPGDDRPFTQALFDVHHQLLRRRNVLRNEERTPEEIEAAAMERELSAARDAQVLAAQKKGQQIDRAVDRSNRGQWLTPWERSLVDSA